MEKRTIFASYSHKDHSIVQQLRRAYRALGDDFFQDIHSLKSGQDWDAALLSKIEDADIFQLAATQITAGSTWNFSAWFRDPAAGGAFFNLSDGLEVTFGP